MSTHADKEHWMAGGDPDIHLEAVARFVSEAFAGGQHIDAIAKKYLRESHYDWGTSRLIWDEELLVHHWGVWGIPDAIGEHLPENCGRRCRGNP